MLQILAKYYEKQENNFKFDFVDYDEFLKIIVKRIKQQNKKVVDIPVGPIFSFLFKKMDKAEKYIIYKKIMEKNEVYEDLNNIIKILIDNVATKEEIIEILPFIHKTYCPAYVLEIIKKYRLLYSILINLKKNDKKIRYQE